ncbi:hypothetical protein ACLI09_07615 [Flavobacterium sp. RHBU_24]|uniref:hypothetical protein n=1 Tax=Flavobacterium sp. RHBU_24 TaxID=3391185 RepID=UPI00398544A4
MVKPGSKTSENVRESIKLLESAIPKKRPSFTDEDLEKGQSQEQTLEQRKGEAELERYNQDTTHRKGLVTWAATVVSLWLLCVLITLSLNTYILKLSDTIMVALLSTTTVNVLGLMIIVLNDLFRGKKEEK